MKHDELTLNRGSDLDFKVIWPDGEGRANLAGYSVDGYDVHKRLAENLVLSITDAAQGEITGRINWRDDMPVGREMHFRVRITIGEHTQTTPLIWVNVT